MKEPKKMSSVTEKMLNVASRFRSLSMMIDPTFDPERVNRERQKTLGKFLFVATAAYLSWDITAQVNQSSVWDNSLLESAKALLNFDFKEDKALRAEAVGMLGICATAISTKAVTLFYKYLKEPKELPSSAVDLESVTNKDKSQKR